MKQTIIENKIVDIFSFLPFGGIKQICKEDFFTSEYLIMGHFTSSFLLTHILKEGLQPPSVTTIFSNAEQSKPGDEKNIYLIGHIDDIYSQNAVKKYGGTEILILVQIKRENIELDDFLNHHSSRGIMTNSQEEIYEVFSQTISPECCTKTGISPDQIIEVLDVNKIRKHTRNIVPIKNRVQMNMNDLARHGINIEELRYTYYLLSNTT